MTQPKRSIPRVCAHCGAAFLARADRPLTRFCRHACQYAGRTVSPISRFWPKVRIDEETGCWEWIGGKDIPGYGMFFLSKSRTQQQRIHAHRWAYEFFIGPIPDTLPHLDHLCRNRGCVCPWHVEPVTAQENLRRGDTSHLGAYFRAKTHCPQGHPYDEANTLLKHGGRHCRECARLYALKRSRYLRALAKAAGLPARAASRPRRLRELLAQVQGSTDPAA